MVTKKKEWWKNSWQYLLHIIVIRFNTMRRKCIVQSNNPRNNIWTLNFSISRCGSLIIPPHYRAWTLNLYQLIHITLSGPLCFYLFFQNTGRGPLINPPIHKVWTKWDHWANELRWWVGFSYGNIWWSARLSAASWTTCIIFLRSSHNLEIPCALLQLSFWCIC